MSAPSRQTDLPKFALFTLGVLAALVLLTRTQLFGEAGSVIVHDASWAAFVLGGFLLRKLRYFAALALLATAIDYSLLCVGSASGAACLTSAYTFLPLSWLTLWIGGQLIPHGTEGSAVRALTIAAVAVTGATVVAYLVSNTGFYLFSGFYAGWSVGQYADMAVDYFAPALWSTLA